jgi:SAM-dependent methyltransferase
VDEVSKQVAVQLETARKFLWQDGERLRFNKLPQCSLEHSLGTPLEYAFQLLGDIRGKTVVDLGCGDGLNTVILASLGARVLSVDISDQRLELTGKRAIANGLGDNVILLHSDASALPIDASSTDAVFAAAILHDVDPIRIARQIRRVLKPGGVAVFKEPIAGSPRLAAIKNSIGKRALTLREVEGVCRAVGIAGRRRAFWLTTRFVCSLGASTFSPPAKAAQRLDAIVLRHFPFISKFASPLVWEARKES